MKGKLFIDGIDAFDGYGIFIEQGGYAGIFGWPALKSVETVDWTEEDGLDADLSDPQLDVLQIQIPFCCVDYLKTKTLLRDLSKSSYHTFNFVDLGIVKRLRLLSQPSYKNYLPAEVFSLKFAEDDFQKNSKKTWPIPVASCTQRGFSIDNTPLSSYGVWITAGTYANVMKMPDVKQDLLMNVNYRTGAIYNDSNVKFKSKDITLKCLLVVPNKEVFWTNYNALLYDLTQPGEKNLKLPLSESEYCGYYKSSSVKRFALLATGEVICEFDIVLAIIAYSIYGVEYLLAAEDGSFIITEQGDYFIDMEYYG